MCGPLALAILSTAIGAAQSIAQFAAASEDKAANDEAARAAFENDQVQLTHRQMQEQAAADQEAYVQNLEEAKAKANVEVSSAASGVAGLSTEHLTGEISRRAGRNRVTLLRNAAMTGVQLQIQKQGSRAGRQGQINSVPNPSPISLVAGIGGAVLDGFSAYNKFKMT